MRSAADFNQFYAEPDPWRISRARARDRALRRATSKYVGGKSVLELGCGEGHLTRAVFGDARSVTGIDLSTVAIERAQALGIPNACFKTGDFLDIPFKGFDIIAAIECIYYLTPENQAAFFGKVAREHRGKILIISGPIIGKSQHREYFTHGGLLKTFARYGATVLDFRNITANRRAIRWLLRLPLADWLLDWLPVGLVNQRCYIIRMGGPPEPTD
jgi:cyclopropane fatty-acyl-phospholipid synthase-like methyltransferase